MSGILGKSGLGDFGLGFGPDEEEDDTLFAADNISITDGCLGRIGEVPFDTIEITDGCHLIKVVHISASDTISITDETDTAYHLTAGNTITIHDEAHSPIFCNAGDTITLDQGANSGLIKESVGDNLTKGTIVIDPVTLAITVVPDIHSLHDGATCVKIHTTQLLGNTISLGQGCLQYIVKDDAIDCEASNDITLVDGSDATPPVEASDTLVVTDGALAEVGKQQSSNTIDVTDGSSVILIREITGGNTLSLGQGVAYTLIRNCTDQKFSPFGSTDTLPVAAGVDGFRLQWPATGMVTDDLLLPNPQFGNSQRITKSRISRETRGGTLIVYSDPTWPKFDSLAVTVSFLTAAQKEALLTFVGTHLGQRVKLIDWENREWVGIVLPGDLITEDRRNSFTAAFEFEGERVLS